VINIDLGKAFHPRFLDLLIAFVPGLFFEICVLLGNPQWVNQLSIAGPAHYYTTLFISLLLAFVLGGAFLSWVKLIRISVDFCYKQAVEHLPKLRAWRLKRLQAQYSELIQLQRENQKQGVPSPPPQPPQPPKSLSKLQRAMSQESDLHSLRHSLERAWKRVAEALLRRYGIEIDPSQEYWQFNWLTWVTVLGQSRPEDRRPHLMNVSLHATGWSVWPQCTLRRPYTQVLSLQDACF
jgi:hypothetical protein